MNRPNSEFYREQAANTAREAKSTYDPRLLERLRLIEQAWTKLADNARRFETSGER